MTACTDSRSNSPASLAGINVGRVNLCWVTGNYRTIGLYQTPNPHPNPSAIAG